MSGAPLLATRGLCAFYGRAQVLFDLSFSLARGEIVALMGRNGAGKSTTLKALMNLVSARSSATTFAGTDIRSLPTHRIARLGLGYVPEERRIFTDLSVFENLEVGRKAPRDGRAPFTPERLFSIFPNLAEMRGRRASAMSGGEQQMLTIARTLMLNPTAILLDEPSEGLAPVIVEEMANAVLAMKREGIAVLLCEQDLAFCRAVADRAIVLDRGEIRHDGSITGEAAARAIEAAYLDA